MRLLLLCMLTLTACKPNAGDDGMPIVIKVTTDGTANQDSEFESEYSDEKSFSRTQKYVLSHAKKNDRNILIAGKVAMFIGNKKESENDFVIVTFDGRGTYECSNFYIDIPKKRPDSEVPDPICKFDVAGVTELDPVKN